MKKCQGCLHQNESKHPELCEMCQQAVSRNWDTARTHLGNNSYYDTAHAHQTDIIVDNLREQV